MSASPIDYETGVGKIQPLITRLLQVLDEGVSSTTVPFPHADYIHAYTAVYDMCTQKLALNSSPKLYQFHEDTLRDYLTKTVLVSLKQKHGDALLQDFVSRWDTFKLLNRWMKKFFAYLDRYYVGHQNLPTLAENGLKTFKTSVFDQVSPQVAKAILQKVEQERMGQDVDQPLLKKCVDAFKQVSPQSMETYELTLEQQYKEETKQFYLSRAQQWMETESTPSYLQLAETALEQEQSRIEAYMLASITGPKVNAIMVDVLLRDQQQFLLNREGSGLHQLLKDERKDDLARVFRMFALCEPDGLQPVAQIVQNFILDEGKDIVNRRVTDCAEQESEKPEASQQFIHALLDLHTKYSAMIANQFNSDAHFQKALKAAFEQTINADFTTLSPGDKPMSSTAELLAIYSDSVLKTGGGSSDGEKLDESQIEDVLEKVVSLFNFLSDKDVFSDVYRNLLAKRLLNQRSASPFAERSMIQKLKLKCGGFFTSKLEGMLTDLDLGKDVSKLFAQHVAELTPALQIDFTCDVLTTGHWPSYRLLQNMQTVPCEEMQQCLDVFSKFYDKQTSHRKLTWVYSLGNCLVKGVYAKQSFDFMLTTLQCIVLVQFNSQPELTFQQLAAQTQIEPEILKPVLHSLSMQRVKLLLKSPTDKKMDEQDTFRVEQNFTSKIRKVRIPMASLEDRHNPGRVEEDRSMAIEAAIVRIMKTRKRLNHNLLVTEVVNQLRHFKPMPKTIKKKIEHLIERDYLERDDTEQNVYKYLA